MCREHSARFLHLVSEWQALAVVTFAGVPISVMMGGAGLGSPPEPGLQHRSVAAPCPPGCPRRRGLSPESGARGHLSCSQHPAGHCPHRLGAWDAGCFPQAPDPIGLAPRAARTVCSARHWQFERSFPLGPEGCGNPNIFSSSPGGLLRWGTETRGSECLVA